MSDIWEVAKSMEWQGKKHYLALADKAPAAEIAGVFKLLADEEERHLHIFTALQKGKPAPAADERNAVAQAKAAFATLAASFKGEVAKDAVDGYRKALELENKSVAYYTGLLAQAGSHKAALEAIIAEEKKHVVIVQGLIDFASRPKEWLENAEFNHLDQY